MEISQYADDGIRTALYIDPVLSYTDDITANEAVVVSQAVRIVVESATHTLHLGLESALSATFQLYDAAGRLVDSRLLNCAQSACSYPALPSGFYVARVVCQGREYTRKIYW